jgi:hypothetical protein
MNIESKDFRVKPGTKVHLSKWETCGKNDYKSHKEYHHVIKKDAEELSDLQQL